MTIIDTQRQQTEARIRAAADRLLAGNVPAGGRCDIKTLAAEAGVSRAALYRTYPHLKHEFEQRLARLRAAGQHPDPRDAQNARLTDENLKLHARVADLGQQISELTAFQTTAISQLAALHDELHRLRQLAAAPTNVVVLPNGKTRT
jgi:uncharacterized protein YlxW (UPF0749 family)